VTDPPNPANPHPPYPRSYHRLTLTLLKAAWQRTLQLVQQRRSAIQAVAKEMVAEAEEKLPGTRLVEIIEVRGRGMGACCLP